MQGFALDISGVKQIENAIKKMDKAVSKGISDEMSAAVLNIQKDAMRSAPVNLGKLRQSIQVDTVNPIFKKVYSTVKYAPYVEFGTSGTKKSQVHVPPGYEAFAAQYKGKGATAPGEFYKAIQFWVKRKGIDPKLTYPIFRAILLKGIKPQPFMIPALEREKPKLLKRLRNLFK